MGCFTNRNRTTCFVRYELNCDCDEGYEWDDICKTCVDINEYLENNGGCQQICIYDDGSIECDCYDGYELDDDGKTCNDIDECQDPKLNDCSPKAKCKNRIGSYKCKCKRNYSGDGKNCVKDEDSSNSYSSSRWL